MAIEDLESNLGLTFSDQGLLRQALVHRSFLNENGGSPLDSYERMEFLGDAVLELIISTELYRNLPQVDEGQLTKSRSSLVCRPSLARAARRLSLGNHLAMGKGELESGGPGRESILEEAFESVVAAIYLDQGYAAARRFVLTALGPELAEICRRGKSVENPKSRLQELVQARGRATPRYRLVSAEGPDHQPVFTVEVLVDDSVLGRGAGSKKSDAERAAAQIALDTLDTIETMEGPEASEPTTPEAKPGTIPGTMPGVAAKTGPGAAISGPARTKKQRRGKQENLCSPSSNATGKPTGKRPTKASNEAENDGSGVSSMFSGPLTWMRRFGKNSKKS